MKTTVGQVSVVGGHPRDQAANVLADERGARGGRGRERGNLYVLVETPEPRGRGEEAGLAQLAEHLTGVIHQAYYGRHGSVTAGLQQAVHDANRLLFEENRNALPGERRTAGICCAVLRGGDLFIAQAGPAAAYVAHAGRVERFPDASPWLDPIPPEELDAAPLGDRSDVNVALYHVQLEPGDSAMLIETGAARRLDAQAWTAILAAGPAGGQAMVQALLAAAPGIDLSAMALALPGTGISADGLGRPSLAPPHSPPCPQTGTGGRSEVEPPSAAPARPSSARWPSEATGSLEASSGTEGLSGEGSSADGLGRPSVAPPHSPPCPQTGTGGRSEAGTPSAGPTRPSALLGPRLRAAGRRVGVLMGGVGAGVVGLIRRMMPAREASAPRTTVRVGGSRAAATGRPVGRSSLLSRQDGVGSLKATSGTAGGLRLRGPADPVQRALAVVAIAIPIILGIVVGVTLIQRGHSHRAEIDALWQQASASSKQADTAADPAAVRAALTAAQGALGQLLQLEPDHAEALSLRDRVQARLDELDKVKPIRLITELNTYPADAILKRVVVQGLHVFVLDRKGGKVYHHLLDGSQKALVSSSRTQVLVAKNQQVDGTLVGDLVDMVWMGVDADGVRERAALVILESGGTLLEYDPTTDQLDARLVGGRDVRRNPTLIGSHMGRLYLVDVGANQIWRYTPTRDGYSGQPDSWLEAAKDLAGVTDVAVGDGIYMLFADGHIEKMAQGKPAQYAVADWPVAPRGATALAAYPPDNTESLYVADAGSSRIVQTGIDGKFIRQYRLADAARTDVFRGITALSVDDRVERAYLTAGNKLYLAELPK